MKITNSERNMSFMSVTVSRSLLPVCLLGIMLQLHNFGFPASVRKKLDTTYTSSPQRHSEAVNLQQTQSHHLWSMEWWQQSRLDALAFDPRVSGIGKPSVAISMLRYTCSLERWLMQADPQNDANHRRKPYAWHERESWICLHFWPWLCTSESVEVVLKLFSKCWTSEW